MDLNGFEQRKNGDFRNFTSSKSASEAVGFESWGGSQTLDVHCARRQADLYIYNVCNVYVYNIFIYIHTYPIFQNIFPRGHILNLPNMCESHWDKDIYVPNSP